MSLITKYRNKGLYLFDKDQRRLNPKTTFRELRGEENIAIVGRHEVPWAIVIPVRPYGSGSW
jgi:hypothetical protein